MADADKDTEEEYDIPDVIAEQVDSKTIEAYMDIPELEVKWKVPGLGTAELKKHCHVDSVFRNNSLQIITTVEKEQGVTKRYKYVVKKLPGDIIPKDCSTKFKDGQITLVLKKGNTDSWEVAIKRGLEQAK